MLFYVVVTLCLVLSVSAKLLVEKADGCVAPVKILACQIGSEMALCVEQDINPLTPTVAIWVQL